MCTNSESSPNKKINSTTISKTRIKSANPNFLDREKLYEENIRLKNEINKLKENINLQKKENYILEIDINKKEKLIEDMANETHNSLVNPIFRSNDLPLFTQKNIFKANESKLLINLKRQFKDLKKEFTMKKEESDNLKKTLKNTKLNELQLENKILLEEISKLKILYENLLKQNLANEKYYIENMELKDMNNKKDFIILNFQEKLKNMQTEILAKNEETVKMNKFNNTQSEKIKKLKKDLKFQYQINEKLIMTTGNVKESNEYQELNNLMTKNLKEAKKEIIYFKEQNAKNERRINDLKNSSPSIGKFSSLEKTIEENPEENINSKILLINSKLKESVKENENLKKENFSLSEKIKIYENKEYGIDNLLKIDIHTSSNTYMNIYNLTPQSMSNVEILSENQMNEMIYVLIKNFEANRIDANVIEMRLFEDENISSLYQEGKEKLFCEKLSNAILNILKIKFEKDKTSIYSLVKSYLFTVSKYTDKKDFENFKKDFVSLFSAIEFYTSEQRGIMTRKLKKKFLQHANPLKDACKFYDENTRGYITFSNLKKILDHFEFKPNSNLEFLVYLMKSFNDDTASIYELKYENFFKIFESQDKDAMLKNDLEECEEFEEENEESDIDRDKNEDEEVEIEISSTEYKRKISNIIIKLTKALTTHKDISFEDKLRALVTVEVSDYRAIKLSKIIELLNEDYKIILDTLDIYCFFAKFRHDENEQGEFEEYIDCDKLIEEVNLYKRAANETKLIEKDQKENNSQEKILVNFAHSSRIEKSYDEYVRVELETNSDFHTEHITNADFIQLIKNELISKKISYEEFFESDEDLNIEKIYFKQSIHLDDGDTGYNRYIDILDFEKLLLMKEIIVLLHDPLKNNILKINRDLYNIAIEDETLFSDNKINIDYIKFIIEDSSVNENKKFFGYKEIKMNQGDRNLENKDATIEDEYEYDFNFSKKNSSPK